MMFIDSRAGSIDLYASMQKANLPVQLADPDLPYGDVYFVGRGIGGTGLNIGIEHKTVSDVINSIQTNRLQGHQLQGMREAEEGAAPFYDHCWLIIEGKPSYDRQGMLIHRRGGKTFRMGMTINELYKRLTVLHLCGGLNWLWFQTRRDTVKWIDAFYHTWTDKDLDQHKSHLGLYEAPTLIPVSQTVRTLATLPGVGLKVAKAAEKEFGSIKAAIMGCPQQWAKIETTDDRGKKKQFGLSHANRLVEAIR